MKTIEEWIEELDPPLRIRAEWMSHRLDNLHVAKDWPSGSRHWYIILYRPDEGEEDFNELHQRLERIRHAAGRKKRAQLQINHDSITNKRFTQMRSEHRAMALQFSQGSAHTESPSLLDVVAHLQMDCASIENARTFEDFAQEYGYDTDSRRAERIYTESQRLARHFEDIVGTERLHQLMYDCEPL